MAQDIDITNDQWMRYQYVRDNGHLDYVQKAKQCDDFFVGLQWKPADLSLLKIQCRPALTINKIISTVSNVLGEQIFNRSEINFRPAKGPASQATADVLTKVFRQISDNNQLDWVRSDVFADGIVGSRGFFDTRLDFSDNVAGEVRITQLNPKNVLVDPDAEEYDPDFWNDVFLTKWLSPDMIAMLYDKAIAEALRGSPDGYFPYGYDSVDRERDRFGSPRATQQYGTGQPESSLGVVRNVRVIERQYRKLANTKFFVDLKNGDLRPVAADWDRDRIAKQLEDSQGAVSVISKLAPRIRWTVIADKYVLHDDWSPYKHFTVVPYFPHFRRGRTVGLVENLLGPQELLNKVSSQELHIVNTTANSGYYVKTGALKNMSAAELEQRGAQTGIVIELDEIEHIEKIQPNAVPTGLDRISSKSENHIDTISGVTRYDKGNAREDVSGKASRENRIASSANTAKTMDNLRRTDFILARNVTDMVQVSYTEERVMFIVTDRLTATTEQLVVNQVSPAGEIINDLTLGEYAITVTSEPQRDTFEDTQFDQALMLRQEAGVAIPDSVLIKNSKLRDKADIIKEIEAASNSPEAQQEKALKMRGMTAEVMTQEAEAAQKTQDAKLKAAKAQRELQEAGNAEAGPDAATQVELRKIEVEAALEREKMKLEFDLKREIAQEKAQLEREAAQLDAQLKRETAEDDRLLKRAQAAAAMRQPAAKPTTQGASK